MHFPMSYLQWTSFGQNKTCGHSQNWILGEVVLICFQSFKGLCGVGYSRPITDSVKEIIMEELHVRR